MAALPDKYEPPKETLGDLVHAAGRSAAGVIPYGGQAAVEMFNKIIRPPIEKRREAWERLIGESLRSLEEQQLCFADQLMEDEAFIDTLVQASQSAIRTSQHEKREALRNAVLNSALKHAADEAQQAIFIQWIEALSSIHLQILCVLDDPVGWFINQEKTLPPGPPKTLWPIVVAAYPEFESHHALCERVCKELNEKGLLIANSLRKDVNRFPYFPDKPREAQAGYLFADELPRDGGVSYSGSPTSFRNWTTELGRQFLAFITAPAEME